MCSRSTPRMNLRGTNGSPRHRESGVRCGIPTHPSKGKPTSSTFCSTLQATPDGLEQAFVVNSAPVTSLILQIPLSLRHLSASEDVSGGIVLTDSSGNQVGGADPATMFGATTGEAEPVASEKVPIDLVKTQGGLMLSESPNMDFFNRSDVTYPVTIDPGTSISINTDTYVENTNPTTTYGTDTRLKSGYDGTNRTYRLGLIVYNGIY